MGVEIKLTDRDLPVSPAFIDCLHRFIERKDFDASWHDQLSEQLVPAKFDEVLKTAIGVADQVLQHPVGQKAIYRSYELLTAFLLGKLGMLRPIHECYRFICVVGCPRHGGTYLVKQLFRALEIDRDQVPNAVAHDGFPDARPFQFQEGYNSSTAMLQQMAEYLALVEVFFADSPRADNFIIVPKKATKAAYHGAFFNAALGPSTEYVVTLRHPIPACISTYEKSTGLPPDGKFKVRGNIEEWALRDSEFTGADPQALLGQDYFDVYLGYWEQYHCNLVLTGIFAHRNRRVVVYGRESMSAMAREWFERFAGSGTPEEFRVVDYRGRHKDWERKAEKAIRRVSALWQSTGVAFPLDEVMEAQ